MDADAILSIVEGPDLLLSNFMPIAYHTNNAVFASPDPDSSCQNALTRREPWLSNDSSALMSQRITMSAFLFHHHFSFLSAPERSALPDQDRIDHPR
jgi:hypothetical protein